MALMHRGIAYASAMRSPHTEGTLIPGSALYASLFRNI